MMIKYNDWRKVGHSINNKLSVIKTNIELLTIQKELTGVELNCKSRIENAVQSIREVTADMGILTKLLDETYIEEDSRFTLSKVLPPSTDNLIVSLNQEIEFDGPQDLYSKLFEACTSYLEKKENELSAFKIYFTDEGNTFKELKPTVTIERFTPPNSLVNGEFKRSRAKNDILCLDIVSSLIKYLNASFDFHLDESGAKEIRILINLKK